ncbi:hypothetical protein [Streptomyces sp. NPDC052610]|uniref:hypothetical protein n=1 Tax=Streptomyces sp. NPDC052610 TaxID=3154952 RepID=UPI00341D980B
MSARAASTATLTVSTATGEFTFTESLRELGGVTYSATYRGDGSHTPATARTTVTITE